MLLGSAVLATCTAVGGQSSELREGVLHTDSSQEATEIISLAVRKDTARRTNEFYADAIVASKERQQ